jgi:hypothetical protein
VAPFQTFFSLAVLVDLDPEVIMDSILFLLLKPPIAVDFPINQQHLQDFYLSLLKYFLQFLHFIVVN